MNFKKNILFTFTIFFPFILSASDSSATKFKALPIAYYTPETKIAIGGIGYLLFKTDKADSLLRTSNIQLYLTYTQNMQFGIENSWQVFSKQERYNLSGELSYTRFPEYFYGLGNFTQEDQRELYSFDQVKFKSQNSVQLKKYIFAGFQLHYQNMFLVDKENTPLLMQSIPGACGFNVNGTGPLLRYDSRNNILNARKGFYAELSALFYHSLLLSEYNFSNITMDIRKYSGIFSKHILASNLYMSFNAGPVPFRMLPAIGGPRFLRGYYAGRFRDKNFLSLEEEARISITRRLGFVVFGGLGQVAPELNKFNPAYFRYHYGGGLRIRIRKNDDVNLRIDYGLTRDSQGLYIIFAEAF